VLLIASILYSRILVNYNQFVLLLNMFLVLQGIFTIIIHCIWWESSLKKKKILRVACTRFVINFIVLQNILAHKDELRDMVTSREWVYSAYAKDSKGKKSCWECVEVSVLERMCNNCTNDWTFSLSFMNGWHWW